jgi:hypothetical protein
VFVILGLVQLNGMDQAVCFPKTKPKNGYIFIFFALSLQQKHGVPVLIGYTNAD